MTFLKRHWPLILALAVLWGGSALLYVHCLNRIGGNYVYPTDDTYIHMSMARNFAQYGTWGVTASGFSSSTSSPLWTLLMALCFLLFGRHELIPLWMNIVAASVLVATLYLIIRRHCPWSWAIAVFLLLTMLFVPMLPMVFLGMEHIFHAWLTVAFLYLAAMSLSGEGTDPSQRKGTFFWLLVIAAAMTAARYEGLFLVLLVFALFVLRCRYLRAGAIMVAGLLPVVLYGAVCMAKGWYFFPNSILLKANRVLTTGAMPWLQEALKALQRCAMDDKCIHLFMLLVVAGVLFIALYARSRTIWRIDALMIVAFMLAVLLHIRYSAVGWFYRYEAYLVLAGCMVTAVAACELLKGRAPAPKSVMLVAPYLVAGLLVAIMSVPLVDRGGVSLRQLPLACKNIHDQQYQMGLLLGRYYTGKTVALNDIGAVTYLANIRLVDLWGLATMETARAKRSHGYNAAFFEKVCESADIAVVYDTWYQDYGGLPTNWRRIGQWKLTDNTICGGNTVSFYAVAPGTDEELSRNLREFSSRLPADTVQSGDYLTPPR